MASQPHGQLWSQIKYPNVFFLHRWHWALGFLGQFVPGLETRLGLLDVLTKTSDIDIWRFPKIGVPPVIIHFSWIFPYKPSSYWGTPMAMETPILVAFDHLDPSPNSAPGQPRTDMADICPCSLPQQAVGVINYIHDIYISVCLSACTSIYLYLFLSICIYLHLKFGPRVGLNGLDICCWKVLFTNNVETNQDSTRP